MEWISVEDGLPECDKPCLVWDGNDIEIDYTDIDADYGIVYFANTQGYTTHWMPLPSPPEGK